MFPVYFWKFWFIGTFMVYMVIVCGSLLLLPLHVSAQNNSEATDTMSHEQPDSPPADLSEVNWDEEPEEENLSDVNWDEEPEEENLSDVNWDDQLDQDEPGDYREYDQSPANIQVQTIDNPMVAHFKGILVTLFYFSGMFFSIYLASRSRIHRNIPPELIIVLYAVWPVFLLVFACLWLSGKLSFNKPFKDGRAA